MKKIIGLLFLIMVAAGTVATAQSSKSNNFNPTSWSLGLRLGGNSGIAAKFYNQNSNAIEAIVSWSLIESKALNVTGLYEWHIPVIADGFSFYYGVGASVGLWDNDFSIGAAGVAGLEYKLARVPLAFSLDWMPGLNIIPDIHFVPSSFALTIRYCF